VRSDTSLASYENAASAGGFTTATTLLASYKIPGTGEAGAGLAPLLRFAAVNDSPPSGPGGLAIVNPLVGATYALNLGGGFRTAFFFGATVPIGMGGGDKPDPGLANSRAKGVFARAGMDNSLFAVNDVAIIPGVGLGYIAHGFTAQVEATLFQLTRVRGDKVQQEATKTNFTSGLHFGYFVTDLLSIGMDVRYQRWLNAPIAVDKDPTSTQVDNLTIALGPRLHLDAGVAKVRPGIAYSRGLDKPMAASTPNYHIVQLDVPVVF
jgi:hypothetical protein